MSEKPCSGSGQRGRTKSPSSCCTLVQWLANAAPCGDASRSTGWERAAPSARCGQHSQAVAGRHVVSHLLNCRGLSHQVASCLQEPESRAYTLACPQILLGFWDPWHQNAIALPHCWIRDEKKCCRSTKLSEQQARELTVFAGQYLMVTFLLTRPRKLKNHEEEEMNAAMPFNTLQKEP